MIAVVYEASIFISIFYLIILLTIYREHISVYYTLLSISIIMICFGYWQISIADQLSTAIAANQLVYLSGSFILFFMIHCIAELCHIHIPALINTFCAVMGIFSFVCSLSINRSALYYESVSLMQVSGVTTLVKEYGPLHVVYPIYIFTLFIYGFGMVIYALFKKKEAPVFSCILSLCIMTISTGIYMVERSLHSDIEWMPMGYMVCFGIILVQLQWVKMYDLTGFSREEIINSNQFGFIVLNGAGKFEGADRFARNMFPELNQIRVGQKIKTESTEMLQVLKSWLLTDGGESHQFVSDNVYIKATHSRWNEGSRNRIHCIRLQDNTSEQDYQKLIENYNDKLTHEVEEKTRKFYRVQDDIIISMASIVENRDNNTGGHILRTSEAIRVFINHLMKIHYLDDLTDEIAEKICKAAPLHDFGKIAIPDEILNKPGKFTDEEYEKMKEHSERGATIVARILQHSEDIAFRNLAVNIAHYHHEKWDGNGYPEGLQEKEIPFEARAMALADVFDALVSKRVYKEQFSFDKAFQIIEESAGSHFDPDLCKHFLECREELETLYRGFDDIEK